MPLHLYHPCQTVLRYCLRSWSGRKDQPVLLSKALKKRRKSDAVFSQWFHLHFLLYLPSRFYFPFLLSFLCLPRIPLQRRYFFHLYFLPYHWKNLPLPWNPRFPFLSQFPPWLLRQSLLHFLLFLPLRLFRLFQFLIPASHLFRIWKNLKFQAVWYLRLRYQYPEVPDLQLHPHTNLHMSCHSALPVHTDHFHSSLNRPSQRVPYLRH